MIGTFDGVHRAHQKMAAKTLRLAKKMGADAGALSFAFPPRLYFFPSTEPGLLSTVEEKKWLLKKQGLKKISILNFNARLAKLSAEQFFKRYIVQTMRAHAVVVGYNFRFGRNQEGTIPVLRALGKKYSVKILVVPQIKDEHAEPISSGRVRSYLKESQLDQANRLLGYPYRIQGPVMTGQKLGRKLGFATANLKVAAEKILPRGVFVVEAQVEKSSEILRGVCNIGLRPSVALKGRLTVEAHFFDFDKNLYDKKLTIFLITHLRPEKKFASLPALVHQLRKDKIKAQEFLQIYDRSSQI